MKSLKNILKKLAAFIKPKPEEFTYEDFVRLEEKKYRKSHQPERSEVRPPFGRGF